MTIPPSLTETTPTGRISHNPWSDLTRLLFAPGQSARALAPNGGHNTGDNLGSGDVLDLLDSHPGAAIMAPVRSPLVAVDLDGTLDLLGPLDELAADYGAALVYLAASGSPNSAHAIYAAPGAHARHRLVAAVDHLRAWAGVGATAVDVRSSRQTLRVPGAASLKAGGGPVVPAELVGGELLPITPTAALTRALDALRAVGWTSGAATNKRALSRAVAALDRLDPAPAPGAPPVDLEPAGGLRLDARAREALNTPPAPGADRSLHAVKAAAHLYRCGGRAWPEVAGVVMSAPALVKWRTHREPAKDWTREAAKWAATRPDMPDTDRRLIAAATAAAPSLPAHLEPVVLAVLDRMRRVGRTTAVGVAERDLVDWGVSASRQTARRYLRELVDLGVLSCARRWADGPAAEATLWTLQKVDAATCATNGPSFTQLGFGVTTHPVWLDLGHPVRRLYAVLCERPGTAAVDLARLLGVPARTVQRWLSSLRSAGLAAVSRLGRVVSWSVLPLDSSVVAASAVEDLDRRRSAVAVEREAWQVAVSGVESVGADLVGGGPVSGRVRSIWRRLRSVRRPAAGALGRGLAAAAVFVADMATVPGTPAPESGGAPGRFSSWSSSSGPAPPGDLLTVGAGPPGPAHGHRTTHDNQIRIRL